MTVAGRGVLAPRVLVALGTSAYAPAMGIVHVTMAVVTAGYKGGRAP